MQFEKSADAKILINLLEEAVVGQTVSYQQMSAAIGRDVRKHALSSLGTARRFLQKEKRMVFGAERGVGLVRLNDNDVVRSVESDRLKVHRQAKRTMNKLSTVEFNKLDDENKKAHVSVSAQMGAIAMFSHKSANKKIESQVSTSQQNISIGETLKMFGG